VLANAGVATDIASTPANNKIQIFFISSPNFNFISSPNGFVPDGTCGCCTLKNLEKESGI
jgi:hypothetical protein